MEANVQTTKIYTVQLDEIEMLELCEDISNVISRNDAGCLADLRTTLEALV